MTFSVGFKKEELEVLRAALRRYGQDLERGGYECDDVIALRQKISNILKGSL